MHAEAMQWVAKWATAEPVTVLDIGGRFINGSPRHLFPGATLYRVLDIAPGAGVDIVADASTWTPDQVYDVVVCTEVFEHTAVWPAICATAYAALRPGGMFITTMAGPGRAPHSAVDGGPALYPGEHYANIEETELAAVLTSVGFVNAHETKNTPCGCNVVTDYQQGPADVRATAVRGGGSDRIG